MPSCDGSQGREPTSSAHLEGYPGVLLSGVSPVEVAQRAGKRVAAGDPELAVDVPEVELDRLLRDEEGLAPPAGPHPPRHKRGDAPLAGGDGPGAPRARAPRRAAGGDQLLPGAR